jgi:hypothetical protein
LIMPFVLGAKGSGWAWRNGRWDSLEHFKRVRRLWAIWGAVIWIGALALFGGLFFGSFQLLKHSAAYELGVSSGELRGGRRSRHSGLGGQAVRLSLLQWRIRKGGAQLSGGGPEG